MTDTAIQIWPANRAPAKYLDRFEDEADWVVRVPGALIDGTVYEDGMPPEWLSGEFSPLGFFLGEDEEEDGSVVSFWGKAC